MAQCRAVGGRQGGLAGRQQAAAQYAFQPGLGGQLLIVGIERVNRADPGQAGRQRGGCAQRRVEQLLQLAAGRVARAQGEADGQAAGAEGDGRVDGGRKRQAARIRARQRHESANRAAAARDSYADIAGVALEGQRRRRRQRRGQPQTAAGGVDGQADAGQHVEQQVLSQQEIDIGAGGKALGQRVIAVAAAVVLEGIGRRRIGVAQPQQRVQVQPRGRRLPVDVGGEGGDEGAGRRVQRRRAGAGKHVAAHALRRQAVGIADAVRRRGRRRDGRQQVAGPGMVRLRWRFIQADLAGGIGGDEAETHDNLHSRRDSGCDAAAWRAARHRNRLQRVGPEGRRMARLAAWMRWRAAIQSARPQAGAEPPLTASSR
ncbi:hypothetical protein D3C87_683560 [compost metagenome]